MIRHGERLRNLGGSLSWRDLKVILEQQEPRESAVWREKQPDVEWGLQEHLLAMNADMLRMLFWAKTKDGSKNRNRPKPIERPGARPERLGRKPLPLDEMDVWLTERVSVDVPGQG